MMPLLLRRLWTHFLEEASNILPLHSFALAGAPVACTRLNMSACMMMTRYVDLQSCRNDLTLLLAELLDSNS